MMRRGWWRRYDETRVQYDGGKIHATTRKLMIEEVLDEFEEDQGWVWE